MLAIKGSIMENVPRIKSIITGFNDLLEFFLFCFISTCPKVFSSPPF